MIKHFMYIEITDGGAQDFFFKTIDDIFLSDMPLPGWLEGKSKSEDERLVEWIKNSSIGEVKSHRMGWCFRLRIGV